MLLGACRLLFDKGGVKRRRVSVLDNVQQGPSEIHHCFLCLSAEAIDLFFARGFAGIQILKIRPMHVLLHFSCN